MSTNLQQIVIPNDVSGQYNNIYTPSSSEKKKCVLMYILFGVLITLGNKQVTEFEYFHLKQSLGRWVLFLLVFVMSVVLIFIPFIKILGILPLIGMVGFRFYFVFQAWNGKYKNNSKSDSLGLFAGLGGWVFGLFQVDIKIIGAMNKPEISQTFDNNQGNNTPNI